MKIIQFLRLKIQFLYDFRFKNFTLSNKMPKITNNKKEYTCVYCSKCFTTNPNLLRHQRTSKTCMLVREMVPPVQKIVKSFICEGCNKSFDRKETLTRHQKTCVAYSYIDIKLENIRLREETKRLQEEIKRLREENDYLKKNPRNVYNNNNINIIISEDYIRKFLPDLCKHHLTNGARGMARFALEGPFSRGIKCVDFSRRILEYLDEKGSVRDIGGRRAICLYFSTIQPKVNEKARELIDEEEIREFEGVEGLFSTVNTVGVGKNITKYMNLMKEVDDAANGIKTEFTNEFITEVCELL